MDKVMLKFLISLATTSELLKTNKSTFDMCASAVAQLKVAGLSQSAISGFVSSMEEMVFEIQSQAQGAALLCVSPQDTATKRKIVNPFTMLNSEAKRKRLFTETRGIVEPSEIVLVSRRNKTTGLFDQVLVTDKFAYIPILETPKAILLNPLLTD